MVVIAGRNQVMLRRSAQAVSLWVFLVAGKSTFAECPTDSFEKIANLGIKKGDYICDFPKIQAASCGQLEDSTVSALATSLIEATSRCKNEPQQTLCSDLAKCLELLENALKNGRQISAEHSLADKILAASGVEALSLESSPAELGQRLRPLIRWLHHQPVAALDQRITQLTSELKEFKADLKDRRSGVPNLTPFPYLKVVSLAVMTSLLTLFALRFLRGRATKQETSRPQGINQTLKADSTVPPPEDRGFLLENDIRKVKEQVLDLVTKVAEREPVQPQFLGIAAAVGTLQTVTASYDEKIQGLDQEAKRLASQVGTLIRRLGEGARPGLTAPGPIAPLPRSVTVEGPKASMPAALPPVTMPEDLVLDTLSRSLEDKLVTTWKGFRKRRQVDAILSAFEAERGAEVTVPPHQGEAALRLPLNTLLITNLSEAIGEHPAAQPAYLLARGPYDTWWSFSTRLSGLRDVVSAPGNQAVSVGPTAPREKPQSQTHLFRVWDGLQLLATAELSDLADRLSSFSVKGWIRTDFLRFADVLMLERDRSRGDQLKRAYSFAKAALDWAGIIPIEIRLGQERFDSSLHVAKASDTKPHLADGVILSVVRNGFLERGTAGGKKILQRPEVIVNRV